jgi:hypothetical protein
LVNTESNILQWIKQPSTLKEEDEQWLKDQIEKYPWSFANYALLAKLHTNHKSFLQPKYLQLASVYTTNRNELYNFINDINAVETHQEVVLDKTEEEISEKEQQKVEQTTESAHNKEVTAPIEEQQEVLKVDEETTSTDTDDSKEEAKFNEKSFVLDGKPEEVEITATEEEKQDEDDVEEVPKTKEIFKIDFDEIVKYDPLKELKPLQNKPKLKENLPADQVVYNPEVELVKLIEEKEEAEESGKQDFAFWLNHLEEEESEPKEETSAEKVQDLLDKFLATKRKRPIQNREFYNPEVKAEQSEEDRMDVISETLAQLYVTQKHYKKAIEAYRKLSLQNPNKSAFFAARIKELEKLTE